MRAIDEAAAASGVPTRTLMRNAGRAVAEAIMARFSPRPTAVLCGPGNNGGDGWVAARFLREKGWPVWIETLVDPTKLRGDAADAAKQWTDAKLGEVFVAPKRGPDAELYVDSMFGAGLSRSLDGDAARRAQELSKALERVVAVDVPSGLDGDTGAPVGETCVRAAVTVTFVRKKPAHVLMPGRAFCGEIVLADIGAPEAVVAGQNVTLHENDPALWLDAYPWPSPEAHKHARGHVTVASGGHARSGAARLAARGALRVGAGLVTVLSPPDAMAENAGRLDAIMLREAGTPEDYFHAAANAGAVVIGPAFGLTDEHRVKLEHALDGRDVCGYVLDADALTLLRPIEERLWNLPHGVLTPHVGEFKRCFPGLLEKSPSRVEAVREAAKRSGAIVLLKGPDTVIAHPKGDAIVNTTGTPFLATAGSGDVLAGLIGGLIGQGMGTFEAAAAGAWLHGKAAEAFGPGLIAEDLPDVLPSVLKLLWASRGDAARGG